MNRSIIIADPTYLEEKRSEANLVFGLNSYRELCGLHFGGITLASLEQLIKCANNGAKRANTVVKQIKAAIEADEQRRAKGELVGFMRTLQLDRYDAHSEERAFIRLPKSKESEEMETELGKMKLEQARIKSLGSQSAVLMPAEELSSDNDEYDDCWIPQNSDDDDLVPIESTMEQQSVKKEKKKKEKKSNQSIERMSDESEEEETVTMKQIT